MEAKKVTSNYNKRKDKKKNNYLANNKRINTTQLFK